MIPIEHVKTVEQLTAADREILHRFPDELKKLFSEYGFITLQDLPFGLGPFGEINSEAERFLRGRGLIFGCDEFGSYIVYLFTGRVIEVDPMMDDFMEEPLRVWDSVEAFISDLL
jgi:hypothetical protein